MRAADDILCRHQETGAKFLAERAFAYLTDEPGAGKTATCVEATDRAGYRKVLISCPAVVRSHWANNFARWQRIDRPITVVPGKLRHAPSPGVTVISHAAFSDDWAIPYLKQGSPYDVISIDEIHQYCRYDSLRTRAALGSDGAWTGSRALWGLSGTPIVNSAADLYPMVYGPMQQPITWWDWCQEYVEEMRADQEGWRPIGLKNEEKLAAFLRPYFLRRTLPGVGIHLPPLHTMDVATQVDRSAMAEVMAALSDWTPERLALALETNDELRDVGLARVRRVLGLAKAPAVAGHVYDMVKDHYGPVVVFFQHTDVRKFLFEMLSQRFGLRTSWIDGTVTRPQLAAAEKWFQAGRLDVLLVQTSAGGVGLSLTAACRTVVAELPWTAVAQHQAIKRIHRIGQTRECIADVIRASGCWLEEALAKTIAKKHKAAERLLSLLETRE